MFKLPAGSDKVKLTEELLREYPHLLKQRKYLKKRIFDGVVLIKKSGIVSMLTVGPIEFKSEIEKIEDVTEKNVEILRRYDLILDALKLAINSTAKHKHQYIVILFYIQGWKKDEIIKINKISEKTFYREKTKIIKFISEEIFF